MGQGIYNFKNRLLALLGGRGPLRSGEEVFAAARRLVGELRAAGWAGAAAEVQEGFSGLNGLTDGWAYFLEHLEKADKALPAEAGGLRKELRAVIRAARYAVYGGR